MVFPATTEEVSTIAQIATRYRAPMVPFGVGSSLEGHVNAVHGGISVDLSRMNRILRVSVDDLDCQVEAGVTHRQLNKALANSGVFFSVDPGADATIGGMAATRASGTTAVRYGTMREVVLGLVVVLPGGRVIHTGGRARKSSSGYDLTHLFVGSEGTLGIITELTLRLYGLPEAVSAAVCPFETMEGAVQTVMTVMQLGVQVARIELLDEPQVDAVNRYSRMNYPLKPTLFFEFHGTSAAAVSEQAQTAQEIAAENGGTEFRWATAPEDRSKLWQARHNAFYAALALRPGSKAWTTDVCVPISRLAECILETRRDVQRVAARRTAHGPRRRRKLPPGLRARSRASRRSSPKQPRSTAVWSTGRSRWAAHARASMASGLGKMDYLPDEHGAALDVMKTIKHALDPDNLMNPGKMFSI